MEFAVNPIIEPVDLRAGWPQARKLPGWECNCNHQHIVRSRELQKYIYFCFIDYAKAFDCGDHDKLWKILKEMGILDHPTCLLRNLYAGQEATV